MKTESIVDHIHARSCTAGSPRIGANWKQPAPVRKRPVRPEKTPSRRWTQFAALAVIVWFAMFPSFLVLGRCGDAGAAHLHQWLEQRLNQAPQPPGYQAADRPARQKPSGAADWGRCRA